MRFLLVAVAMLFSLAPVAFAADPVGTYEVQGNNPGGSTYEGTVTVTKTGDTYHVVWEAGRAAARNTRGRRSVIRISWRSLTGPATTPGSRSMVKTAATGRASGPTRRAPRWAPRPGNVSKR